MSPIAINKYINQFIIYLVPSKYISQMIAWLSLHRLGMKMKSFKNGCKVYEISHQIRRKDKTTTLQSAELWGTSNEWSISTNESPGVLRWEMLEEVKQSSHCGETSKPLWSGCNQFKNHRDLFTTGLFKEEQPTMVAWTGSFDFRWFSTTNSITDQATFSGTVNYVKGDSFSTWLFPNWIHDARIQSVFYLVILSLSKKIYHPSCARNLEAS